MTRSILLAAAAALTLAATGAHAHGSLVSSSPAAGATARPTAELRLRFNEPIHRRFSGAELVMTSMIMNGRPAAHEMKVQGVRAQVDPKDPRALVLSTPKPLTAGGYRVTWHVVTPDNHRVEGSYAFTIR